MSNDTTPIKSLLESAEAYSRTTIELVKLHAIDKSADVVSSMVSRLAVIAVIALFVLILNIGLALWIGELLGKSYFGFFIVGGAYALFAILLHICRHSWIKIPISNSIISQLRKQRPA